VVGLSWQVWVAQTAGGDACLGHVVMAAELFGRDSEIAAVELLLAGIGDGGGSLLVLGDPGIGKSALAAVAGRRARCGHSATGTALSPTWEPWGGHDPQPYGVDATAYAVNAAGKIGKTVPMQGFVLIPV
jgi:AAA ATPase domain